MALKKHLNGVKLKLQLYFETLLSILIYENSSTEIWLQFQAINNLKILLPYFQLRVTPSLTICIQTLYDGWINQPFDS